MDGAKRSPVTAFSHVQLLVRDVPASERWYRDVLGLERLTADDGYVALCHRPSKAVIVLSRRADGNEQGGRAGALDHLAFGVPDGEALEDWAEHLTTLGIEHDGVVDELGKPSLGLTDPDGIRIELVAPPGTHPRSTTERTEPVG